MCKELKDELRRGDRATKAVANHHFAMGGSRMTQTVKVGGVNYRITSTRSLKKPTK